MLPMFLAAIGALCAGTGAAIQHKAAGEEDDHAAMDPRLLLRLLRRRTWLLGIGIAIFGYVFQGSAIGTGRLVLVEPILTLHVLFALLVAARLARRRLGTTEWRGAALTMVGVAGFVVVADPQEGHAVDPVVPWIVPLAVLAVLVVVGRTVAVRLAPSQRALLLGALAGLAFGTSDALFKLVTEVARDEGVAALAGHWSPYAWAAVGPIALLLQQSAFHIGHLGAALPASSSVQPCVAALLGALMFDEQLRGGWAIPFELAFAGALIVGVVVLARSPLIEADVATPVR